MMKSRMGLMMAAMLVSGAVCAAQDATPAAAAGPVANPVTSTVKAQLTRYAKNMVAAADAMPADKFNYKPTPEMNTFAHLTMHIAMSNYGLCSKISGQAAPDVSEGQAGGGAEGFV
jgi:hypothetical protein